MKYIIFCQNPVHTKKMNYSGVKHAMSDPTSERSREGPDDVEPIVDPRRKRFTATSAAESVDVDERAVQIQDFHKVCDQCRLRRLPCVISVDRRSPDRLLSAMLINITLVERGISPSNIHVLEPSNEVPDVKGALFRISSSGIRIRGVKHPQIPYDCKHVLDLTIAIVGSRVLQTSRGISIYGEFFSRTVVRNLIMAVLRGSPVVRAIIEKDVTSEIGSLAHLSVKSLGDVVRVILQADRDYDDWFESNLRRKNVVCEAYDIACSCFPIRIVDDDLQLDGAWIWAAARDPTAKYASMVWDIVKKSTLPVFDLLIYSFGMDGPEVLFTCFQTSPRDVTDIVLGARFVERIGSNDIFRCMCDINGLPKHQNITRCG